MTDPPQEILDLHTIDDQAEAPDPQAEAYANVGTSTSLLDLAVGAATDVGAATSLAIGLGQSTPHTLRSRPYVDVGRAPGGDSAPAASELLPMPSTHIPLQEWPMAQRRLEDPSQVYLLTPMEPVTLFHVKSTTLHCPPRIITRQRVSVDSKLLRRPRNVGYYRILE